MVDLSMGIVSVSSPRTSFFLQLSGGAVFCFNFNFFQTCLRRNYYPWKEGREVIT